MHMLEQHQGKDHVSAQDQAYENMADSGDGVYLAKYKGEYMEVSMESANQLTVSAGALWVNGRFCIVDPAETLAVDNGSSGMTEYDLVCVHWKETTVTQQVALAEGGTKEVSTTVEETELAIVKGDPASSGATDPEISQTTIRAGVGEAWVPFARITKDGLTPSVAFIVDRLVPESDFRDSISLTVTPKNTTNAAFECFAYPGLRLCFIVGSFTPSQTLNAGKTNAYANVDPSYKPIRETALSVAKSGSVDASVWLTDQGELIACAKYDGINTNISFSGMWRY